jgi:hypothetical protein
MEFHVHLRIVRWIFAVAGLYGTVLMIGMLVHPPAMLGKAPWQQPEIYYGFATMGLAWQVVFFLVAADPQRYRLMMFVSAVYDKLAFVAVLVVLLLKRRAGLHWIGPAVNEFVFGMAFLVCYILTVEPRRHRKEITPPLD